MLCLRNMVVRTINAEYGAVWTMGMLDGMHLPKDYFGEMEKKLNFNKSIERMHVQ